MFSISLLLYPVNAYIFISNESQQTAKSLKTAVMHTTDKPKLDLMKKAVIYFV